MTPNHSRRRTALKILPLLLFMGNKPYCDLRPPTLTCGAPSITLRPGSCADLVNPCGDQEWVRLDGFQLCDAPPGLYVQTTGTNPRTRAICADPTIEDLANRSVEFHYQRPGDSGLGQLFVTVEGEALGVVASAIPGSIPVGGLSQLNAVPSGGVPPYSYAWSPAAGLSSLDIANPVAQPTVSTVYTVVVTDSEGVSASASATVNVGIGAEASALPQTIAVGQRSNLSVDVTGGTPPYSFSWTPSDTLSASDVGSPVATPIVRTTYDVLVTDFLGATAVASVTVDVTLTASASANPASITAGQSSQLDVAVAGGAPPYTFDWSPRGTLDEASLRNPVATPAMTTRYDVIVTDAVGVAAASSVTVTVTAPALNACFTFQVLGPLAIQVDGSCSSGAIVEYRWWSNFLGGSQPPTLVETDPIPPVFLYEVTGTRTLRLEVVDGSGGTAVATQIVPAP